MLVSMGNSDGCDQGREWHGCTAFRWLALIAFTVASVFGWQSWRGKTEEEPITRLDIGDGSGLMGHRILAAAAMLAAERPVRIEFVRGQGRTGGISVIPRKVMAGMPCDWMSLEVTQNGTKMNDEPLSLDELTERLATYVKVARLTDSLPFFILRADEKATGERLVAVFGLLYEAGIVHVNLPDPLFEMSKKADPPRPQIIPQAHPVRLN